MTSPVRALWAAPAASPAPPRRVWRDWALVFVVVNLLVDLSYTLLDPRVRLGR